MTHPCEKIYNIGAEKKVYGKESGMCRIIGKQKLGVPFEKWVKATFNDFDSLFPGTIISNEALFCFDEASEILKRKTGKDKLQRFRTYSHIIKDNKWYCVTKADKELIFNLIIEGAELVCLTDTGQRHILFKHKPGMWQLEDLQIVPDIPTLRLLHSNMCDLMDLGFSQSEIITGNYLSYRIFKAGLGNHWELESVIKPYRGSPIFDFTSFMLYSKK